MREFDVPGIAAQRPKCLRLGRVAFHRKLVDFRIDCQVRRVATDMVQIRVAARTLTRRNLCQIDIAALVIAVAFSTVLILQNAGSIRIYRNMRPN